MTYYGLKQAKSIFRFLAFGLWFLLKPKNQNQKPNHLNFKVERLNKANNIATITNLKTIFGSFQPDISK